jgi:hypothetical protein
MDTYYIRDYNEPQGKIRDLLNRTEMVNDE